MQSCGMNAIKYILFIFNLLFAISGLGIIIAGGVVLADVAEFNHFMEGRIFAPPIVLIIAGGIVFFVAFLGCYGAIRESRLMLMGFAVCLLIIFILELAAGIAAAVFKNDFQLAMKDTLKVSMTNYSRTEGDQQAWENIQKKLMCCGVDGPSDWLTEGPNRQLPHSCCYAKRDTDVPPTEAQCRRAHPTDDYVYQTGCYDQLKMKVNGAANILIGVGIGIAFIEIIGIFLACWLGAAIKREEEAK